MRSRRVYSSWLAGLAVLWLLTPLRAQEFPEPAIGQIPPAPLSFVENAGQFEPSVRFGLQMAGTFLAIKEDSVELHVPAADFGNRLGETRQSIVIALPRSERRSVPVPFGRRGGTASYYFGNDPSKWVVGAPIWSGVRFPNISQDADLEITGENGDLRWRWVVADEGAAPKPGTLNVTGAGIVQADDEIMRIGKVGGGFVLPSPVAVRSDGSRIDSSDTARRLESEFEPVSRVVTTSFQGVNPVISRDNADRFWAAVSVANPDLQGNLFDIKVRREQSNSEIYVGGNGLDEPRAIVAVGNTAFIAGMTVSSNFPTTSGTFQTSWNGGTDGFFIAVADADAFMLLNRSTYMGGPGADSINALVSVPSGFFFGGETGSNQIPGKVPPAVEISGSTDALVGVITSDFRTLLNFENFGGSGTESVTTLAYSSGLRHVYAAGPTSSINMPTSSGVFQPAFGGLSDSFLAAFDSTGRERWLSYFGGAQSDRIVYVAPHSSGDVLFCGDTSSSNLPVTKPSYQETLRDQMDGFFGRISADGRTIRLLSYLDVDLSATPISSFERVAFLNEVTPDLLVFLGLTTESFGFGEVFLGVTDMTGSRLEYFATYGSVVSASGLHLSAVPTSKAGEVLAAANESGTIRILRGVLPGSASGRVFKDTDRDGFFDLTERLLNPPGYANVTVYADENRNAFPDILEIGTISGSTGTWSLTAKAGIDRICARPPSSLVLTTPSCRNVTLPLLSNASNLLFGAASNISVFPVLGISEISPSSAEVQPGERIHFSYRWTHPEHWRKLHTMDFLLADDEDFAIWIRFEEESNTLAVFNPAREEFGPRFELGHRARLETEFMHLELSTARIAGDGQDVVFEFDLRPKPKAAGRVFRILEAATGDNGADQGPDLVGELVVGTKSPRIIDQRERVRPHAAPGAK